MSLLTHVTKHFSHARNYDCSVLDLIRPAILKIKNKLRLETILLQNFVTKKIMDCSNFCRWIFMIAYDELFSKYSLVLARMCMWCNGCHCFLRTWKFFTLWKLKNIGKLYLNFFCIVHYVISWVTPFCSYTSFNELARILRSMHNAILTCIAVYGAYSKNS